MFRVEKQAAPSKSKGLDVDLREANRDDDLGAFEHARLDLLETGFLLAAYETLIQALKDRRLHQGHRSVLAELVSRMNRQTGTTFIGREQIAQRTGLPVRSVSNYISELMRFGYVVAENRRTPEANNRSLRHYTLAGLDKAEIERLVAETIKGIQSRTPRSISKVSPQHDFQSHAPTGQIVDSSNPKSRSGVHESHAGACTVTNRKELTKKKEEEEPLRQSPVVVFQVEPLFADTVDAAVYELAKVGCEAPNENQIDLLRSEIAGCVSKWNAPDGETKRRAYASPRGWFRAKWMPRLKEQIAQAGRAAPSTGNSLADAVARRLAQIGGAQ